MSEEDEVTEAEEWTPYGEKLDLLTTRACSPLTTWNRVQSMLAEALLEAYAEGKKAASEPKP